MNLLEEYCRLNKIKFDSIKNEYFSASSENEMLRSFQNEISLNRKSKKIKKSFASSVHNKENNGNNTKQSKNKDKILKNLSQSCSNIQKDKSVVDDATISCKERIGNLVYLDLHEYIVELRRAMSKLDRVPKKMTIEIMEGCIAYLHDYLLQKNIIYE